MNLTIAELHRVLEYIPKQTAPDLHEKFLAELTSQRFYEATQGLRREAKWEAEDQFINHLTDAEMEAWVKRNASMTANTLTFKE